MKFKQKILMLAPLGFGIGVIAGTLIAAIWGTLAAGDGVMYLCPTALVQAVGNPLAAFTIQAVSAGVYGAFTVGGSALYDIEEWGLLKCTVIHYIVVMGGYFILAFSLRWFTRDDTVEIVIVVAMMTVGYFIIWLVNYLSYKVQLNNINKELDELKKLSEYEAAE